MRTIIEIYQDLNVITQELEYRLGPPDYESTQNTAYNAQRKAISALREAQHQIAPQVVTAMENSAAGIGTKYGES